MQAEIGEVAEPYQEGRGGSSTMPQKRNPIACEFVLACARNVRQLVAVMLDAMVQDHERATGPWHAEWIALPQAFALTAGALHHIRRCSKAWSSIRRACGAISISLEA